MKNILKIIKTVVVWNRHFSFTSLRDMVLTNARLFALTTSAAAVILIFP